MNNNFDEKKMMIIDMDNYCEQPQMFLERWGSRDEHTCGEYPMMMMMTTMMMMMMMMMIMMMFYKNL